MSTSVAGSFVFESGSDGIDQPRNEPWGELFHAFEAQSGRIALSRCIDSTKQVIPQAEDNAEVLSIPLVRY